MSNIKFILCFLSVFICNTLTSQSIRKNYNEMTASEKNALVQAFVDLRTGLVDFFATFHRDNFDNIHFKATASRPQYNPTQDVFFTWHRQQIYTLEHAMQAINPKLSIPFWDWTIPVDKTASSPLWNSSFMGSFGTGQTNDWGLGRNLGGSSGGGSFPSSTQVSNLQNISSPTPIDNWPEDPAAQRAAFINYVDIFESSEGGSSSTYGSPHVKGHAWVGGVMPARNSPLDPIFYLHHTNIDRLFQEFVEARSITSANNLYARTDMPLWDGTNAGYDSVNPDDLVDSKTLGVFYADANNDLAELHDYSVNNTFLTEEVFYYQFTIEAKDNFVVPNGKSAKIESVNTVILKPGFHSESGSNFIAKIDTNTNPLTLKAPPSKFAKSSSKSSLAQKSFIINENIFVLNDFNSEVSLIVNSKEKDMLGLNFKNDCNPCKIEVIDSKNNVVLNRALTNSKETSINLQSLLPGTHLVRIELTNNKIINQELLKF